MSLMSRRVQGTCHRRAWLGLQPPQGSPLSQVFLRNLQRRQARSLRISCACCLWSGRRGPRLRPIFFSPVESFLLVGDFLTIALVTLEVLSVGDLRRRRGGEVGPDDVGDVDEEPAEAYERATAPAVGLTANDDVGEDCWWPRSWLAMANPCDCRYCESM
jgi:hypothetical protein